MPFANFPKGFANGVTIQGMPILMAYATSQASLGNTAKTGVYWVDSVNGLDGNPGTYQLPLATLNRALALASANDIVMLKPGHAETITTTTNVALSTASVTILGLGYGSKRPTFTFSTNATANIPITAANVIMSNCLFVANKADVASFFTATGTATPTDFWLDNCEFRDTSSILNALTVVTGNATANSMDGFKMTNCRISSLGTTAATTAIVLAEAADRVTLTDNYGTWAALNDTAAFLATGANSVTNFDMGRNHLFRPNTSSTGGSFVSSSGTAWTGLCYDNYMWQLDATAGIWIATGTKLGFLNNFSPITGAADKSGLINPAAV